VNVDRNDLGSRIVIGSAIELARTLRAQEKQTRAAYPGGDGPLREHCGKLADAHGAAAAVYEQLLKEYE
jgi:hypothetical protein